MAETQDIDDGGADGSRSRAGDGERQQPPGPSGLPLIGNSHQLVRDPFAFFETLAEYGDVVRYDALGREFTALLHPDHIERVLVEEPDRFERFLFSDAGFDFAADGILFNDNEQGDRQRRLLRPAFTMDRVRSYTDGMVEHADATMEGWTDGDEVAVNREYPDLTLRILAKTLFDVDIDPEEDDAIIARASRAINEAGDTQGASVILPRWVPTPTRRRYDRAMAQFRERMDDLIAARRSGTASGENAEGEDLLSLLLAAEGPDGYSLSESEVRDNLVTFMFAGHETTSLALTYTTMLLAAHDDAAERVRAEVDEVLDGEPPRFEHLPQLEHTEQAIREALRLYPPAYAMWREATEETVIGGYRIPEGMLLTLPQFHVHTDERFWDAPDEFRPDRWDDERERPEYAYFPFGGGPRHCIGMRFAMLELQLVVALLVQRFDLTLLSDPDPSLRAGATLQPRADVRVRVSRR